jgi:dolichol-phosphate mannosyltransferase
MPKSLLPPLSIIIPFYNEEENVGPLLEETLRTNPGAEIIAVDDGSTDSTRERIRQFREVRLLALPKNLGQSAALFAGLQQASHELCVLMDGDGQNDPANIRDLLREIERFDLVCGYRRQRQDSWQVKRASRIANRVRRFFTHDTIRDAGCTLKVLRKSHVRLLIPFTEMQCYMVAMLQRAGLKVGEIPVNHRPRRFGRSKYTILRRAWRGIWDLIGIQWLLRRQIRWPSEMPAATLPWVPPATAEPIRSVPLPVNHHSIKDQRSEESRARISA